MMVNKVLPAAVFILGMKIAAGTGSLHSVFLEKSLNKMQTAELSSSHFRNSKDTLKIGDRCPDFLMENQERKQVKLSKFRGKYVLIDVWASWCYPCRKQIPSFESLMDEFKNDEIVFLGMNIDERDFRWLGQVKNLQMKGNQWHVLDKDFQQQFGIAYIPRYILLDKKGYVIQDKMTIPSDEKTKEYLTRILKKQ